jgi:hypothetical protein
VIEDTQFDQLTPSQALILRIENFHYMAMEFRQKLLDPEWMSVHGKELGQAMGKKDKGATNEKT